MRRMIHRTPATPPGEAPHPDPGPVAPVADWLRRAVAEARGLETLGVEDIAMVCGAAFGALDRILRREERAAGAWRQRLALSAAAFAAKEAGRVEGEAALRDAVLLTRSGDDVGPAGNLLLAWRRLAGRPTETLLSPANLAAMLGEFGFAADEELAAGLVEDLRDVEGEGMVATIAAAFDVAERHGFTRMVGAWLADAVLARQLGWPQAVPLSGLEPARFRRNAAAGAGETGTDRTRVMLAATARAALRAIDLSVDMERRAGRLIAVAPKLRARAAGTVVARLLSDDAIVASERIGGISDRGMRRLFDRLVELGAVRELSGRPTFRVYGL